MALSRLRRLTRRTAHAVTATPIRFKVLGMVLATILLFGLAVTLQVRSELEAGLETGLQERGVALARDLAEDAADLILTQNTFGLHQALRGTLETNPDVRYVFVVDAQDRVLAHSFPGRVSPELIRATRLPAAAPWQARDLRSEEGLITDVAAQIFDGRLGVVHVGMLHQRVAARIAAATRRLLLTTAAGLLAGGGAVLILTHVLTRPINELVTAVRAVGEGDLTRRPKARMADEVGELTVAFNAMADDLARYQGELLRQNKELSAANNVARALSRTASLDVGLGGALTSALQALGCEAGWIALRTDDGGMAVAARRGLSDAFSKAASVSLPSPCRCEGIARGVGAVRRPLPVDDCPRLRQARRNGWPEARFRQHLSVPVVSHNQPLGVMNFALADGQSFDDEHVALAAAIGGQVGVAVDADRQRRRLLDEVARRERLRGDLLERVLGAQEEERRRISRELHDEASQSLTSLMVGLRLVERDADNPAAVEERARSLRGIADGVLEGLHRLAMDLRPATLEHLGLDAALRQHVEAYHRRLGIKAQYESVGLDGHRLPEGVETELYRIVQEALANVARHARARNVGVLLERHDGRVVVIVEDDGVGFEAEAAGGDGRLGLFGIAERAEMMGGSLSVESRPGAGTTVFVEVPDGDSRPDRG